MADSTNAQPVNRPGFGWRRRMTSVGAVLAAVVVYYVETAFIGLDLATPAVGNRESTPISFHTVFTAALIATGMAWFVIAALERFGPTSRHARPIWTVIAVIVFLASLAAPFAGTGIETSTRFGLAAMHVVVAAILIPLLPDWPPRSERVPAGTN